MKEPPVYRCASLGSLSRLRELLDLLADLRTVQGPITSAEGLRKAIGLLLRLAGILGLDPAWRLQLESILLDEAIFRIVLAVVQYVLATAGNEQADGTLHVAALEDAPPIVLDQQTLLEWLPLVVQLLRLLQQLREAR